MKKLLVIGIIVLFVGLAFIPSFNAVSISKDIESMDTRTIHVACLCDEYWGTPGEIVLNAIVTLRSNDGLLYRVQIGVFGDCNFLCIPTYYNETNLNIDAKHIFNDYRVDYIKWINDNCVDINFLVNWNKPKDDNILENIPKFNPINQDTSDSENDCDCQSNGKTHLAEKLLNRLEKNEVLSNVIKPNKLQYKGVFTCNILEKIFWKLESLFCSLYEISIILKEDTKLYDIIISYMWKVNDAAFDVYLLLIEYDCIRP